MKYLSILVISASLSACGDIPGGDPNPTYAEQDAAKKAARIQLLESNNYDRGLTVEIFRDSEYGCEYMVVRNNRGLSVVKLAGC